MKDKETSVILEFKQPPKEALTECIIKNARELMVTQLITLDLLLTGTGYIMGLFLMIFSTIVGNSYLIFIGVFILVPTIVHTIDGVTRRSSTLKPNSLQ